MSRKINLVVIHCSDSDVPAHDNIETIRKWHVEENGWREVGYQYFVDKAGVVHPGRSEDESGSHVKGYNSRSIGICLSGRHEFTPAQFKSLEILLIDICGRYDLEKKDIVGHCDLDKKKTCPNLDLHKLLASWSWH